MNTSKSGGNINRSISVRKYSNRYKNSNIMNSNYSMFALRRNPKAQQLADDFDPETVGADLEALKRNHHYLIEKSLNAGDPTYLRPEDADEQLEQMKNANQELLDRVCEISSMVKEAVTKVKQEQTNRRQKQRDQIIKNFNGEAEIEDPNVKKLASEKKKLYKDLKLLRSEIFNLKLKFQNAGGTEKLTSMKDEYKALVEQNYELLEEVKLLQRNKKIQSRAANEEK